MTPETLTKIKQAYERLVTEYKKLSMPETKDYVLTLSNANEMHLIKTDGTKSVCLGRIFETEGATMMTELTKVWKTIQTYFAGVAESKTKVAPAPAPVVEEVKTESAPVEEAKPVKKARKTKKTVVEETPVEEAVEVVAETVAVEEPAVESVVSEAVASEVPVVEPVVAESDVVVTEEEDAAFDAWQEKLGE